MKFRKTYGSYRIDKCPFCGKQSVTENSQGVPVCALHKNYQLPDMKCICGEWLDIRKGKFGAYFSCMRCGNISWSKAMEANPFIQGTAEKKKEESSAPKQKKYSIYSGEERKETVVTSDELDFMF